MKMLLTGGAGYVGSACLRWLIRNGHEPFAFDNLSLGNAWSVPSDRLIVGDILDFDGLSRALREYDIEGVIHFAALAVVPESVADPASYWQTNVVGTKTLLDAMRSVGVRKIVFSSTCAVYGENHESPLTETMACNPCHPYGSTKMAVEQMIREFSAAYGIGHTSLRYFNVAGADSDGRFGECRRHETHLIPLILAVANGKREKLVVFGTDFPTPDGTCVRDYIHTEDLSYAHQLAMEQLDTGQANVFNVGTGVGASVLEVLHAAEEVAGFEIPHELADRRPGDPPALFANAEKIRAELNWQPKYTNIRDIVETAWNWHRNEEARLTEFGAI
ncbi:MAG: UDP-glucose 4-epimerase GalE [Planctomycetes bacterium]|nr:UDP-glucose 4-epimerase GalE [Planctomycetota bacterium]